MKVLVTGSAGFIGFHTSKALLERGDQVIGVDNFNEYYDKKLKEDRNKVLEEYDNLKLYRGDIKNLDFVKKVFKENDIDKVAHIAAQAGVRYSLENPHIYIQSNIVGFVNVIEQAQQNNVENFVYASSSSIYGNNEKVPFSEEDRVDRPISLYAATKKSDEVIAHTYHHLYNLNCTGLRYFTVIGPWSRPDMALYKFTKLIDQGKEIDVYNHGNMKRDFTYVGDIVDGTLSALDKNLSYEIFNLGNNKPIKLGTFIEYIEEGLGKKAKKNMMDKPKGDMEITYADIEKAKVKLDYSPDTDVKTAVNKFIKWYKNYS